MLKLEHLLTKLAESFCPTYTAYSVTVNYRIALFQQLAYCIEADAADSAISVTPLNLVNRFVWGKPSGASIIFPERGVA